MSKKETSLDDRFDEHFAYRDKIDAEYWKESDRLQDEYDKLMKELEDS